MASNLVASVAEQFGLTQKLAKDVVSSVLSGLANEITSGEPVRLSQLGTFSTKVKPARNGRNPKTGETITIAEKTVVVFKANSALKEAVNA